MTNTLIMPTAPAPPAPAAGCAQAASPAREAPETQAGSSFKEALAAARKSDAESSADPAPRPEPDAKKVDPAPTHEADETTPLKQALLAAMVALAGVANSAQPMPVVKEAAPADAKQPADTAATLALQAQLVTTGDDQAQAAAPAQAQVQTQTAQAAKTAQFVELLKAQAQPEAETKAVAQTAQTAQAAPAAAQPLTSMADGVKLAAAKADLEGFGNQLKAEVEKPPATAEKPVAQPLDLGQVKAATTFNVNELARLSEARPNSPLPMVTQIQQGVETLTKSGQTSLRLQLYPEALGRVDLRLTSGADGVRVSLTADLSATGNLLERHAQELRQALSDSGLTVAGLSIGFNLGQGKSSTAFEWQPPVSGRSSSSGLATVLEPDLDLVAPANTLDLGRVDYRI
jgi:flagellar hook-length control protein FliK